MGAGAHEQAVGAGAGPDLAETADAERPEQVATTAAAAAGLVVVVVQVQAEVVAVRAV